MRSFCSRGRVRRPWSAIVATIALASATPMVLAACGGSAPPAGAGTAVGVTERDFHISSTTATVPAGDVVLRVHNAGPDQHELILATDRTGRLPFRADGFTVNEEEIQNTEPGVLEPGQPGTTRYLKVHLNPGRYVLFCNMAGHYMAGMYTTLTVSS
jgi:uncharacterized cupredoxin-like copper-binding protein